MRTVHLPVDSLKVGQRITEDIFSLTATPVITARTSVTEEIKEVLRAFSIRTVPVEEDKSVIQETLTETSTAVREEVSAFERLYREAVRQHKTEYSNWVAGSKAEVPKVRQIVLPPGNELLKNRSWLLKIHRLSSENDYIHHHAVAVGLITGALAQRIGFPQGQVQQLMTAGALADSGMAKIDQRIFEKKSTLSTTESLPVQQHPLFSFQYVKDSSLLKPEMKLAIVQHHERLDGSGYPQGEKPEKISLFSQLIAVADTYHALVCDRHYRKAVSPFKALEMLQSEEFGKFHTRATDALAGIIGDQLVGRKVRLTDESIGEVIFIQPVSPFRPLIRLEETGDIIDLNMERSTGIKDLAD